MKNIHVLPTDKPSRLIKQTNGKLRLSDIVFRGQVASGVTQNIYITSYEKIKEGDWFLCLDNRKCNDSICKANEVWLNMEEKQPSYCKKIILTTDVDLIKDGVQAIDDEFLEWFVKNPSCEYVTTYDGLFGEDRMWKKQIIIPKEEIYFDFTGELDGLPTSSDAINYSLNAFKVPKEYFGKEEPKQETLEEAVNKFKKTNVYINEIKQEQERSYSEEEVLEMLKEVRKGHMISSSINNRTYWEFDIKSEKKWFEQFKKK